MRALLFIQRVEKREEIPSAIFLLGEERQLHAMVVRAVVNARLGDDGEIRHIDAAETPLMAIIDAAASAGLFTSERVVVAHNAEALKAPSGSAQLGELERLLSHLDPSLTLIFSAASVNRAHQPFKLLSAAAEVVECDRLKGAALREWIQRHVADRGFRFAGNALEFALELLGDDMAMIVRALEKTMLYCGERRLIEYDDVAACLDSMREHAVWELTAAIGERDGGRALGLLTSLLSEGKHPLQITSALQYQFRQLITVKALLAKKLPPPEIARQAGIRFFAERVIAQAKSYRAHELSAAYNQLFELENAIKSAGIDERYLLENTVIRICSESGEVAAVGKWE